MTPPLDGLVVVDFSELLPGPFLTQSMVELGAEVIKIERPPAGDATRRLAPGVFEAVNRGKSSVMADLKQPAERERVVALIEHADVLVEAYRPGVMSRLGLDYATLEVSQPRLIYASLTGYGQSGPMALLPGHDVNYLATGGAIALSGLPHGAPAHAFGLPAADLCAANYALSAILAALVQRGTTGPGQHLDIAMADCVAHWMNPRLGQFADARLVTLDEQRADALSKPAYGAFRCADGMTITVGALEDHFWRRLCGVIDMEPFDGEAHASYTARVRDAAAINLRLADALAAIDAAAVERTLQQADVPVARAVAPNDLATAPQFAERRLYAGGLARFPVRLRGMAAAATGTPKLDTGR